MTNLKPIVLHIFMLACLSLSLCLDLNSLFKSYVLILCHLDSATSLLPRHYCHIITTNATSDFETSCLNYAFVLLSPMQKTMSVHFNSKHSTSATWNQLNCNKKQKKRKKKKEKSNDKTVGQTSRKNAEKSPWTSPAERPSAAGRSPKSPESGWEGGGSQKQVTRE